MPALAACWSAVRRPGKAWARQKDTGTKARACERSHGSAEPAYRLRNPAEHREGHAQHLRGLQGPASALRSVLAAKHGNVNKAANRAG
jgi:hypothetical protein